MPPWRRGDPAVRDNPMLWFAVPGVLDFDYGAMHTPDDLGLRRIFDDDGKTTRRVRTYGHWGEHPDRKQRPHYLATRGGVAMHTDPGFARFSHHLILVNEGYRTTGPQDLPWPPLVPGTIYALDTYAPHAVIPDPRVGTGGHKLDVVIDTYGLLMPEEVAALLQEFLWRGPKPC